MAAPPLPAVFSSGPGKSLALVPGGGQVQPVHLLQSAPQPSVTMVRVVTSNPLTSSTPNGYGAPPVGGAGEASSELRGILVSGVKLRCELDTRTLLHLGAQAVSNAYYTRNPSSCPLDKFPSVSEQICTDLLCYFVVMQDYLEIRETQYRRRNRSKKMTDSSHWTL